MDPNYYAKTLANAFMKLGPLALYVIGGYFLCIKLPFWLMTKFMKSNRSSSNFMTDVNPSYKEEDYDAFIRRLNAQNDWIEAPKQEKKVDAKNEERPKQEFKREEKFQQKSEQEKHQKKGHTKSKNQEKEKAKPKPEKEGPKLLKPTPEEVIFNLTAGQSFSKDELKKRYHDLLRAHHPDKVASLAPEFKKMAEKKTKEINSAYDRLKKKAA